MSTESRSEATRNGRRNLLDDEKHLYLHPPCWLHNCLPFQTPQNVIFPEGKLNLACLGSSRSPLGHCHKGEAFPEGCQAPSSCLEWGSLYFSCLEDSKNTGVGVDIMGECVQNAD